MNKVWMCSGSTYTQVSSGYSVEQSLPVGIYSICLTMTGYHLDRYADKFVFPYKMYGLQNEFIDHVIRRITLQKAISELCLLVQRALERLLPLRN